MWLLLGHSCTRVVGNGSGISQMRDAGLPVMTTDIPKAILSNLPVQSHRSVSTAQAMIRLGAPARSGCLTVAAWCTDCVFTFRRRHSGCRAGSRCEVRTPRPAWTKRPSQP